MIDSYVVELIIIEVRLISIFIIQYQLIVVKDIPGILN